MLDRRQKVLLVLVLLAAAVGANLNFIAFFIVINAVAMFYYLALCAYKFYLIDLSLVSRKEIHVTKVELAALTDEELPVYTPTRSHN